MLDLQDDWDGDGSPGYAPETWELACRFLWNSARSLWKKRHVAAPAPAVLEGPGGSIDIYWKLTDTTLLVNVPVNVSEKATYFLRRADGSEIMGSVNTSGENSRLLRWLVP
jgi:hypothetical protein